MFHMRLHHKIIPALMAYLECSACPHIKSVFMISTIHFLLLIKLQKGTLKCIHKTFTIFN